MKIRKGFVSNSSSSSFILSAYDFLDCAGLYKNKEEEYKKEIESAKRQLEWEKERGWTPKDYVGLFTEEEVEVEISRLSEFIDNLPLDEWWAMEFYKGYLLFSTSMDNFDMLDYLKNTYGSSRVHPVLEIPPHNGFKHEEGIAVMKKIIDVGFHDTWRK